MFSTSNSSKVMACVAMMMTMMVMTEAAAMPKLSAKTHKKSTHGAVGETVSLQLDPNAWALTRNIRPLHNDSISPWTYNVSNDDSLFPPMLAEARCLLQGCLDSEGKEDLNLESRPIMHQVLVLRRVRSGDNYHFRLESRLVAVGCTCVRPNVRHQKRMTLLEAMDEVDVGVFKETEPHVMPFNIKPELELWLDEHLQLNN